MSFYLRQIITYEYGQLPVAVGFIYRTVARAATNIPASM